MKDSQSGQNSQLDSHLVPESPEANSVTCLSSNNSIEGCDNYEPESQQPTELQQFSPYAKKQADALRQNVERLISLAPSPDHVAFLTLTFKDNVKDHREAYRRFRSLNTNFIAPSEEYGHWLLVKERQKRGAWHYHIVVICSQDVRTDFSWAIYDWWLDQRNQGKKRRLTTGNEYLRHLWKINRKAMKKYGFGIAQILPMRKNAEAMAKYVGKYLSKHMGARLPEDKGVRLIQTSKGWPKNSVKRSWYNHNSRRWRRGVRCLANLHMCPTMYALQLKLGKRWAFDFYHEIVGYQDIIDEIESRVPF